jgi:hypothetical protein
MTPRMVETATVRSCWMGPLAPTVPPAKEAPPPDLPAGLGFLAAASISARTMRPPGPEPVIVEASTPFSAASFLARGEILTRSPEARAGAGAGAGAAAAGAGAAGAEGAGAAALVSSLAGAAAGAAGVAGASTVSPSLPTAQSGAPKATCEPASAKIFKSVPSKKHSSSIVALSVSTSASMSPDLTTSPSFLSHLTSVPTVIVSLSFGISMILAILGKLRAGC